MEIFWKQSEESIVKATVNENCISCGLCASTCPEVFSLTDAGVAAAIPGEVAPADEAAAQDAQQNCPVDAIEQV